MPVTGLYYLPVQAGESARTQEIINRLNSYYNPTPLPSWSLSHLLYRETPSGAQPTVEKGKVGGQRYLQTVALSYHAPRTYVAITATNAPSQTRAGTPASSIVSGTEAINGEPATVISISSGSQSEFFQTMSKLGSLWQAQPRQTLHVPNGQAFEVGDFRVRLGELRQGSGGGGAQMGKGTVVEVQWSGGEEGEEDWESAEAIIGGFWDDLEIKGAKKVFWVPGLSEGEGSVRQWFEILRIRV